MTSTGGADSGRPHYLPFVDGMRAIAILAVVVYHVAPRAAPAGYVGVDVFFVISGFLIIGHIADAHEQGRFNLTEFWARRVLRIIPPYLLTLVLCLALAPFVLVTEDQYTDLGEQVRYSAFMIVNHLFLAHQGYFDSTADSKLLLNLWSLAVEEQFYLLCPLVCGALLFVHRRRPLVAAVLVALVFVVSLATCVMLTPASALEKNLAFFLTPFRVWEFMLGWMALVCARALGSSRPNWSAAASSTGLGLVLASVFLMDSDPPFPSYWAAVPCVGAALLLVGGVTAPSSAVSRLLARRPLTFVGRVSYPWYLLHWPLLVFASVHSFGTPSVELKVASTLTSFVLAIAVHLGLERPIQRSRVRSSGQLGWRPFALGGFACVAVALGGETLTRHFGDTAPQRVAVETAAVPERALECHKERWITRCKVPGGSRDTLFVTGDSFAGPYGKFLGPRAAEHGLQTTTVSLSGCAPFYDVVRISPWGNSRETCANGQAAARKALAAADISVSRAVMVAWWWAHLTGLDSPFDSLTSSEQDEKFAQELDETLGMLVAAGADRVLIIGSVPIFAAGVPQCIAQADRQKRDRDEACSVKRGKMSRRQSRAHAMIRKLVANRSDVRFIDPTDVFCDAEWCRGFRGDRLLYADHSHLSSDGVQALYRAFIAEFEWVLGARSVP